MDPITSRQNPIVRRFREAAGAPGDSLLLDGPHLIEEALAASVPIELIAVDDAANGDVRTLARRVEAAGARLVSVTSSLLSAMSPVRQPSGIVAIGRRREQSLDDALREAPQMVLMLEE